MFLTGVSRVPRIPSRIILGHRVVKMNFVRIVSVHRRRSRKHILFLHCHVVLSVLLYIFSVAVSAAPQSDLPRDIELLIDNITGRELSPAVRARLVHLAQNPVDLALADGSRLRELPGIGRVLAERILALRRSGELRRIDDLTRVRGISTRLLDRIRPFIQLNGQSTVRRRPDDSPVSGRLRAGGLSGAAFSTDTSAAPEWSTLPLYSQIEMKRGENLTGFLSASRRHLYISRYNLACSCFQSENDREQLQLDAISLRFRTGQHEWLAGDYQAGFALGVTFDQTSRRYPNGFYSRLPLRQDLSRVRLGSVDAMRGLAWQYRRVKVFTSWRQPEIYQYDLRYGPDVWIAAMLDADPAYKQDADGRWYRTALLSADGGEQYLSYKTLSGRFNEALAGGQLRLASSARFNLSMQGYTAAISFTDTSVNQWFADASRYPDASHWAVMGVAARYQTEQITYRSELAVTQSGAPGMVAELEWERDQTTIEHGWRMYHADFQNPYAGSHASDSEYQGIRQRNEIGGHVNLQQKLNRRLEYNLRADLWGQPWENDGHSYQFNPRPVVDAEYQAGVKLERNRQQIEARFQVRNKHLFRNGRQETYLDTGAEDYGRGERRLLSLRWRTAIHHWQPSIEGRLYFQDVSEFSNRFDREARLIFYLAGKFTHSLVSRTRIALRMAPVDQTAHYLYDREAPQLGIRQYLSWKASAQYTLKLAAGYDEYLEQRPGRYPYYLFSRLEMERSF